MIQALANSISRFWLGELGDGEDDAGQRFKTCCNYDQLRQEPASVDMPYLYDDGHPQEDPDPRCQGSTCRKRDNAAKLQQCQMRVIISNAFVACCEQPAADAPSKIDFKDWMTVVGDVLPVKKHHQHTMALMKRAWFITLGEKNLYVREPSSDSTTDVAIVPYVTTKKTRRLIYEGGRVKLRMYKDEVVKTLPDNFET
eukprot:5559621-Amphidinium_carterae.1